MANNDAENWKGRRSQKEEARLEALREERQWKSQVFVGWTGKVVDTMAKTPEVEMVRLLTLLNRKVKVACWLIGGLLAVALIVVIFGFSIQGEITN